LAGRVSPNRGQTRRLPRLVGTRRLWVAGRVSPKRGRPGRLPGWSAPGGCGRPARSGPNRGQARSPRLVGTRLSWVAGQVSPQKGADPIACPGWSAPGCRG